MKRKTKLKKTVFVVLLAAAMVFAALIMFGGEGIRWFGEKSENAGEIIKEHTDDLGDRADEFKEDVGKKADRLKEGVGKKATELKHDVKKRVSED
jgi:hypothetical protein